MSEWERNVALEWRAYIASFIRTLDPNTERLNTSRYWPTYNALGSADSAPVRFVTAFAFSSNANASLPTGSQPEIMERAQLERCDYWLSDDLVNTLHL